MKKSNLPGNGEDHFGMVPVGGIWKNLYEGIEQMRNGYNSQPIV
ncbi:MAG: hypothetical protein WC348_04820 [Patescibacteria group bacterium]|jgi:hypothetical protein